MADIIKTESISKDFAKTDKVWLDKTSTTALVFVPEIHSGGVRGHLIRYKKNEDEGWEQMQEMDFKKLKLYEGVHNFGTKLF